MKKYLAILKTGWQEAFEYRVEFFLSLAGWFVRLAIALFIWAAVFKDQNTVGLYNFESILTYFLLIQIVVTLVFSRVGFQVGEDIHTGDFSNYLTRPISYPLYQIFTELSRNLLRTLLGALAFLSILAVMYPSFFSNFKLIKIPVLIVILLLAYSMNALISCSIGYTGFWLTNSNRLMYVYFAIITAISGMTAPLDLFPEPILNIMNYLPFSYIFYYPVKVIQADMDWQLITFVLSRQLIFLGILLFINQTLYKKGVKKYEAVGH